MWSNKKPEKVAEQSLDQVAAVISTDALHRNVRTTRADSPSPVTVSSDVSIASASSAAPAPATMQSAASAAVIADPLPNPFQVDLPVQNAAAVAPAAHQPAMTPSTPPIVEPPIAAAIEPEQSVNVDAAPAVDLEPVNEPLTLDQRAAEPLQIQEPLAAEPLELEEPLALDQPIEPVVSRELSEPGPMVDDEPVTSVLAEPEPVSESMELKVPTTPVVDPGVVPDPAPVPARGRAKGGAFAGLTRLFGPRVARAPAGKVIYAIGDVHGCDDLLEQLLDKVEADAAAMSKGAPELNPVLVFLGDYVDRGPDSNKVIDRLLNGLPLGFETRFLKGNHEDALLRFVEGEAEMGGRWRSYGGGETLASYGVELKSTNSNVINWEATRVQFDQRVPREHREFLRNLETMVVYGDYAFVHAGVRPGVRLHDQTEHDVMWIRDEFLYDDGALEKVIVHGHTAQTDPFRNFRRIGVDTGAYSSGVLTAVRLVGEQADFIQTAPQNPIGRRSAEFGVTSATL